MNEEDIVELLKLIKGMKDISLSGGSDLIFYTNAGKKIETEEEVKQQQEVVKSTVQSSVNQGNLELVELRDRCD